MRGQRAGKAFSLPFFTQGRPKGTATFRWRAARACEQGELTLPLLDSKCVQGCPKDAATFRWRAARAYEQGELILVTSSCCLPATRKGLLTNQKGNSRLIHG